VEHDGENLNAFLQDIVELFMHITIPIESSQAVKSYKDLIPDIEMPNWLVDLLKLSFFAHYFRGESSLSEDLQ
jgi:hypothetical protein